MSSSKIVAKHGEWKSPITSDFLVKGSCKAICELQASAGTPFWIEQTFPAGQRVLYERGKSGEKRRWSPEGVNCNNSVHEYGGGCLFLTDTRVYICSKGGIYELNKPEEEPRAIVSIENVRHADPHVAGDYVYAVQERHDKISESGGEPENLLIRAHISTGEVSTVAVGADFYAEPRISPDGKQLAWIEWNKPNMPWDITSVHVAQVDADGSISHSKKILDGSSLYGLQWGGTPANPILFVISDVSGYWNVYTVDIEAGRLKDNLYPTDRDVGGPFWQFADDRPFALDNKSVVLAVGEQLLHASLSDVPGMASLKFSHMETVSSAGFTVFSHLTVSNRRLFSIAAGPKRANSLIEINLDNFEVSIVRESRTTEEMQTLDQFLSVPKLLKFDSDGVQIEGYFYPPTNPHYTAPGGSLPPVIFFAHPGPTMRTTNGLDFKKQYYTSKGFAIFDINYRGSTGTGREFRNMLLGNWGVVDTNDMINGAKYLIKEKLVDPARICIMGSSAGGFLVLSVLIHPENVFSAAVSVYGVSDLEDLFNASHKFESDYTVKLIAPYPEGVEVYKQRSAVHNLDKIKTPVAFLHGLDDPVVPYKQSELCFNKLKEKGVTTALRLFPGESHGFRSVEAVTKSMDLSYAFFCHVLGIAPTVENDLEIVN
ncbi:prolyl oligopeptidase family domain-containing protein [Ditylenchus destructor]|nr:prolyl oligopeptidase family domain-containing protein [Ditylenchus destructor]